MSMSITRWIMSIPMSATATTATGTTRSQVERTTSLAGQHPTRLHRRDSLPVHPSDQQQGDTHGCAGFQASIDFTNPMGQQHAESRNAESWPLKS